MNVNLLEDLGLHPEAIGPAVLPDFQIRIGDRATLVPNPGSMSYGIVTELSDNEANALYTRQGLSDYRPETVDAILVHDRSVQHSFCYNLPQDALGSKANAEYAKKLSTLVLELGFPPAYGDEIINQRNI